MGDNMQYGGLAGLDMPIYQRYAQRTRPQTDQMMVGQTLPDTQDFMKNYLNATTKQAELINQQLMNKQMSFGDYVRANDGSYLKGTSDWLTKGGNMQTGLAALGAAADMYGAYKQSKYQDKMADLAKRQQDIYEQEVKRQQQRQDRAQAAYDKAQGV